ncbi:non-canonical poly(A) polymerase TRF5 [Nakaseomyces bracarensis]|uniref:non-canonical poly(A) polymerase TRF5 n=1 Tax=Nakaseomyces bracarensis TaxID=273131 RepID=UPI003870FD65
MRGERFRRGSNSAKNSKKTNRVKRMRKSSFNAVQRNLEVFNDNKDFLNKYENLALDLSDPEDGMNVLSKSNDDLVLNDGESKAANYSDAYYEIPEIEVESGDEGVFQETVSRTNSLEHNDDFIALGSSSEEDEEVEEESDPDIESTDDEEDNEELAKSKRTLNSEFPWILNHDHSRQREISDWLTAEIRDFVSYISPSKDEIKTRNRTISKIRRAVKELWPDSDLHVFGSYATDLYLPGSDIDCVINSKDGDKENRQYLYELARHLKQEGLATRVEVIAKARVPIIKFVEPESDIHIDVSFERTNGLAAAKIIREWIDDTPGLRELALVVKQFLHARRLNDVHTGGLGGFSIICLVFSFLRLHPRVQSREIDTLQNLGVLLIEFFELYGKNFAYDDVAICVADSRATYLPKTHCRFYPPARSSFTLAIQDPGDVTNNISRGSFNLRDIKRSFAGAFDLLVNKCFELDAATFKDRVGKSILGNVIKYKGRPRDFSDERDLVTNKAIIENEYYHQKRARVIHLDEESSSSGSSSDNEEEEEEEEDAFVNISENEVQITEQMYRIETAQKRKKRKLEEKDKPVKKKKTSIDTFMGLEDDETTIETPIDAEPAATLKSKAVDMQTKRDYWLAKGQAL